MKIETLKKILNKKNSKVEFSIVTNLNNCNSEIFEPGQSLSKEFENYRSQIENYFKLRKNGIIEGTELFVHNYVKPINVFVVGAVHIAQHLIDLVKNELTSLSKVQTPSSMKGHPEIYIMVGVNGSGKTTLLRNICGLNAGYEGAISWYGDPIRECQEEFYSSLVYIGHRVGVNKVLTPLENLRWSSSLQQVITDDELLDALEKVGLRGYEDSQCFTLSAGQQQRVSLSKLLLSRAKLWVLDEPFTTLDAAGVKQLEVLLKTHAGNGGAVMVTTHHTLSVPNLQVLELG